MVAETRTFFGVYRIVRDSDEKTHALMHGHVLHGMQLDSTDRLQRRLPLLYYSQSSPIGQVFFAFHGAPGKDRVAVIGLGIGNLAAYADPGQEFTFYEIDPGVAEIARDRRYFTYLGDAEARGAIVRVLLGDGRVNLQREHDRRFGMIVLDAFSGDAIPAHLLTREAFELYLDRLEDDGILALHITNDHVDLAPIVAELALDQKLVALIQTDGVSLEDRRHGLAASTWVLLARRQEHLGSLSESKRWRDLERGSYPILWRDDYTNLLPILRWN
jgi:spermidine synthase